MKLKFTCLRNIQSVVEARGGRPESVEDVLVIRRAYVALREMLDEGGDLNYLYSFNGRNGASWYWCVW